MFQPRAGLGRTLSRWILFAAICSSAALGIVTAAERERDRSGDRSKRTLVEGPQQVADTTPVDIQATFDSYTTSLLPEGLLPFDPSGALFLDHAAARVQQAYKLLLRSKDQQGSEAISTLNRILTIDLPGSSQADKVLSGTHRRLGDLYDHSNVKRLHHYGLALQYARGRQPGLRDRIEELGGDLFVLTFNRPAAGAPQLTPGVNDSCDDALHVALDYSDTAVDVAGGIGDHNWVAFDVVTGNPNAGQTIRIETISNDAVSFDDTDLTLYGGCEIPGGPGSGVPTDFVEFNDDQPGDFMSLIERNCMGEGTYYLEVGGFADVSSADNFTLEITVLDTGCFVRTPDLFEPDDDRANATPIGNPAPPNDPGAIWTEVVASEIQAHNIFPAGDNDMLKFQLVESSLMVLATAKRFPTIFNGFDGEELTVPGEDTVIELLYDEPKDYGGNCNQITCNFAFCSGPPCQIALNGADCPDPPVAPPIPGFPNCLPWSLFGAPINDWPADNTLAINDDADLAGGNLGSEISVCLPRTDVANPFSSVNTPDFDWYLNVRPFGSVEFDYEVLVHNSAKCRFEIEPNNSLGLPSDGNSEGSRSCSGNKAKSRSGCDVDVLPNALVLGQSIHGINEFSTFSSTSLFLDIDVFSFDVDTAQLLTFETHAPQPGVHDTELDIFVGPDLAGNFFFTGLSDDDGGNGLLSRIKANFVPACEFLGSCPSSGGESEASKSKGRVASIDSEYFIAVSAAGRMPDFPYELRSSVSTAALFDTEPNDACPSEAQAITVGDTVLGSIGASCDFDTYGFSLTESTRVSFEIISGGDSVVELVDNDCDRIGCDDDGGAGQASAVSSCLPAGDYNLRVRAYNEMLTFNYNLETDGQAGCIPSDPPTTTGDGLFLCTGDYDFCDTILPPAFIEGGVDLADCNGAGGAQPTATISLGDVVAGEIVPICDYDSYAFSFAYDTEVFIRGAGGDFALQLTDAGCDKIACDDDSGSGGAAPYEPLLAGCLATGDYVVRTRPFSSTVTFAYTIDFGDLGPCDSSTDPPVAGDEVLTCTDFDNGQGCTAP